MKIYKTHAFWMTAIACFTFSGAGVFSDTTITSDYTNSVNPITYDDSVDITVSSDGTVTIDNSTTEGSITATIASGGSLEFSGTTTVSGSSSVSGDVDVTFSAVGTLEFSGTTTIDGSLTIGLYGGTDNATGTSVTMGSSLSVTDSPITFEYAGGPTLTTPVTSPPYYYGVIYLTNSNGLGTGEVAVQHGISLAVSETMTLSNDFSIGPVTVDDVTYQTINIVTDSSTTLTLSGKISGAGVYVNSSAFVPETHAYDGTVLFTGDISATNGLAITCSAGGIGVSGSVNSTGGVNLEMVEGTLYVDDNGALFGPLIMGAETTMSVNGLLEFTSSSTNDYAASDIENGATVTPNFGDSTTPLVFYVNNSSTTVSIGVAFASFANPIQYTGTGLIEIGTGTVDTALSTYTGGTNITAYTSSSGAGNVSFDISSLGSVGAVTAGPFGTGAITLEGSLVAVSSSDTITLDNQIIVSSSHYTASLGATNGCTFAIGYLQASGDLIINSSSQLGIGTTTPYGTVSISGSESYPSYLTGSVTIDGGTLSLGYYTTFNPASSGTLTIGAGGQLTINDTLTCTYPITLGNGSVTISVASWEEATFTGSIQGSNSTSLLATGTGTLSIVPTTASTANIPYITSLVIDVDTTFIGNTNSLKNSLIVINSGGVLEFNQSSSGSYAGASKGGISGDGSVVINGTSGSVLTFGTDSESSLNTYTGGTTLTSGTLSIPSDSWLGDSSGSVTANGGTLQTTATTTSSRDFTINTATSSLVGITFSVDSATIFTLDGSLSGAGQIDLTGGGELVISSTTTDYTGKINSVTGNSTLTNYAHIPTDPTIEAGSLIRGNGTIGALEIYGYLADLRKDEALTVVGDSNFYNGSALISSANLTTSTTVEGTVTIASDTTLYLAVTTGDYTTDQTFLALTSTDGIIGNFGSLKLPSSYFITGVLNNDGQTITVTVSPSEVLSYPQQGNALSVQNALNESIAWNRSNVNYVAVPRFDVVIGIPQPKVSDVLATFLPLEGEEITEALLACQSSSLKNLLVVQENSSTQVQSLVRQRMENKMDTRECIDNDRFYTVWAEGLSNVMSQHERNGYIGYKSHMAGAILGLEKSFYNTIYVGMLGGYTSAHVKWENNFGVGNANAGYFGLYSSLLGDTFYGNVAVTRGWNIYNAKRNIKYTDVSLQATNSHGGKQLLSHADAGVNIRFGQFILRPFDSFDYLTQTENGYTEKQAGEWNLTVKKSNSILIRNELGLQFSGCMCSCYGTWSLAPKLSWVREVRVKGGNTSEQFADTGYNFKVTSYFPDRSLISPGVTLSGAFLENLIKCSAYYNGEFGSGYSSNQYGGEVSVSF